MEIELLWRDFNVQSACEKFGGRINGKKFEVLLKSTGAPQWAQWEGEKLTEDEQWEVFDALEDLSQLWGDDGETYYDAFPLGHPLPEDAEMLERWDGLQWRRVVPRSIEQLERELEMES